jgi:hypothetical protein
MAGDHCDGSTAVGSLVFGTARNEQVRAADDSGEHTADERAWRLAWMSLSSHMT